MTTGRIGAALLIGAGALAAQACGGDAAGSGGAGTGAATTATATTGSQSTGAQSTGASSGGGAGGGGACATPADCPGVDDDCGARTCEAGVCGVDLAPRGTVVADQTPGDCQVAVCDGGGGTQSEADVRDLPDDGEECTVDGCDAMGAPVSTPKMEGTPCSQGAGSLCSAAGSCVECLVDLDCPSNVCAGNVCAAPACVDGVVNGTETDVDCGGATCPACGAGQICVQASDCESEVCAAGACQAAACGDGVVNGAEACDDDGSTGGDGCSAACTVEPGYACAGEPSACATVCGDGLIAGAEACDDGNGAPADGCTACAVDPGFTCTGEPSLCSQPQVVTAGGLSLPIPDDAYTGAVSSMACVDLVVPSAANNVVASVTVAVALSHTWVGDLVLKVVSPSSTVVTVMSLPGFAEPADDGASSSTVNANLVAAFPVTFAEGAATSAEGMGAGLADGANVCEANGICSFAPSFGAALPGTLATFAGEPSNGTWRFCAGDSEVFDTGMIHAVTLTVTK